MFNLLSRKIQKELEKWKRNVTLATNKWKGRLAENSVEMSYRLQGYDVKKIHKGGDFIVQKRDFLSGRRIGKPIIVEVKSGPHARLSKIQRQRMRRLKKRYKVIRTNGIF